MVYCTFVYITPYRAGAEGCASFVSPVQEGMLKCELEEVAAFRNAIDRLIRECLSSLSRNCVEGASTRLLEDLVAMMKNKESKNCFQATCMLPLAEFVDIFRSASIDLD